MTNKSLVSTVACLLLIFANVHARSPVHRSSRSQRNKDLRTLINLLDYIGKDYSNAVENGNVINAAEYREMSEFSRQVADVFGRLNRQIDKPGFSRLDQKINDLQKAIQNKARAQSISSLSSDIRQKILALDLITITPPGWPDLKKGANIFATHCQSCHGKNGFGDGPLAKELTPPPSDFHDSTLASQLSPLQAYNTIRLGIAGTGMRPFHEISDQQAWDVAFYVNALRYQDTVSQTREKRIAKALKDTANLKTLATLPNKKWITYLKEQGLEVSGGMSVLRSMDQGVFGKEKDYLDHAITLLNQAHNAYKNGDPERANTLALNAYLDGVEPVETQIKANNPSLVYRIENQMIEVRSSIKEGVTASALQEKIHASVLSIRKAQNILKQEHNSFWFTYFMSGSILLREGLEAFLIILVILGVLNSVNATESVKYVHGGWMVALLIGIASWFFAESLLSMSSLQRELMEGIGALIAVGLLLYIGFWLHDKTHASQWKQFVEGKIHGLVDQNNRWGLAVLSFIVVFREAFESVIFLSSISIKSGSGNSGILFGSTSAILAIIILGVILIKFSTKLPIRSLFKYSSIVMAVLAFILVGKGMHEFQEAGYLGISSLPLHLDLPTLGLYPTLQTIMAQFLITGIIVGLWMYSNHRADLKEAKSN